MRRAIVGVGGLTVLAIVVLFFQNCSQQGQPGSGAGFEDGLKYHRSQSGKLTASACVEAYQCRVYRYAPDLDDGSSSYQSCVLLSTGEEVCADVEEMNYDSSRALQLCPDCVAADGRPGGKYNYAEIQCGPKQSRSNAVLRAQDARVELGTYLEESIHHCQSTL